MRKIAVGFVLVLLSACFHFAAGEVPLRTESKYVAPESENGRVLFLISDTHMGFGKDISNNWSPTEDFRWPKALKSFLDMVREKGDDRVDLFIVGDFLEMWQIPESVRCEPASADLGCSVHEMTRVVRGIISGHELEIADLREFAEFGDNRLHILPGNHDAALLLAEVWEPLGTALNETSGRINFVTDGVWSSADGKIVVEHGHQIGEDVNRYEGWPSMVAAPDRNGVYRMIRPWGENFVQSVFNEVEAGGGNVPAYPIIDNLAPETAAIRYRMADVGFEQSLSDIARFLVFNLLETSLVQKIQVLGPQTDAQTGKPVWDVGVGRRSGHLLFADAMDDEDPFRVLLLGDGESAIAFRKTMDQLALDEARLSDDDVRALCDQVAIRERSRLCIDAVLGAAFEVAIHSREYVLRRHIEDRWKSYDDMTLFVYGHTHKYEVPWELGLSGSRSVEIVNTGAFQRVVSEAAFLERVARKSKDFNREITPGEALRLIDLIELAPCYTYVEVGYRLGLPHAFLRAWRSDETGDATPLRRNVYSASCR